MAEFCDECDVTMELHYDDKDCEGAVAKVRVLEMFPFGAIR